MFRGRMSRMFLSSPVGGELCRVAGEQSGRSQADRARCSPRAVDRVCLSIGDRRLLRLAPTGIRRGTARVAGWSLHDRAPNWLPHGLHTLVLPSGGRHAEAVAFTSILFSVVSLFVNWSLMQHREFW